MCIAKVLQYDAKRAMFCDTGSCVAVAEWTPRVGKQGAPELELLSLRKPHSKFGFPPRVAR